MAGWAGFSEDELRRLKQQRDSPHNQKQVPCPPEAFLSRPPPPAKKNVQAQTQGKKSLQAQTQQKPIKGPGKATSPESESKQKMAPSVAAKSNTPQLQALPESSATESRDIKSEPQNGNIEEADERLLKIEMELLERKISLGPASA